MASIATRSSVLAIKEEVTEGTPVAPAAATDFIALQDDFSMEPAFDVLENAELRNSIGSAKPILGAENPTVSLSHYVRHSGVEGQAPNYGLLLEAALGTETVNGTERVTDAASTTVLIKAAAGTGGDFTRGMGMLVKDGTNGYRIRVSHERSTDDITPSFALAGAPAAGVSLGKCVRYSPADTAHKTMTVWHYLGNGGATQVSTGCRVTDVSVDIAAGQLINASYSLAGLGYYFNAIQVTSSTEVIDWEDDQGTASASVSVQMFKDPHELASALETAMNAETTETITVTYSDSTGKFTFAATGAVFELQWNTGANTASSVATKVGFTTAADSTGALTYTGSALSFAAPYTPSLDESDPLAAKANEVMVGDQDDYACFEASSVNFSIGLDRQVVESVCATSGRSGSIISGRTVTVSVTALLSQYDADKFARYRQGTETRLQYSFGTKTGGNWVAGKCGYIYLPTATVTSFSITDNNGLATLEMELTAFVDSEGQGEVYIGFL